MRAKPEILPYRRYLYVGEMSLDRKTREKAGQAVSRRRCPASSYNETELQAQLMGQIEFVAPDDFAAVFSGVSGRRRWSWLGPGPRRAAERD